MPTLRKSPKKTSGKQPDYYGIDGDQDSPDITSRKDATKQPSRYRYRMGYKEPWKKPPAPARNKYTKSSSEQEKNDKDGDD